MRRALNFTGRTAFYLFALFVIVSVLGALSPTAAPHLGTVEASTGWYNREVTWWMDSSTNTQDGNQVYRVKMTLAWQTQDPNPLCYSWANAAPDGTRFPAFNDGVSKCPWFRYGNNAPYFDWYPSTNFTIACWVSNAFLVTVVIDSCGRLPAAQDYPPYWMSYGSIFRVCTGLVNTPFSYCGAFKSRMQVLGSTVELWNSTAG